MNLIEIDNYIIRLEKVLYINYGYAELSETYDIMFQFEDNENYLTIVFYEESEYNYWLDYLRKKINL